MAGFVDGVVESIQRSRSSWLKSAVTRFLEKLAVRGLKRGTLRIYACHLFRFGETLAQQGVSSLSDIPHEVEPFLQRFYPRQPQLSVWRSTLSRFVGHLREDGIIPAAEPVPRETRPYAELVKGYAAYLREHRGLCEPYLHDIQNYCSALIAHMQDEGVSDLRGLHAAVIHRFVAVAAKGCTRTTVGRKCTAIRGFLVHLHRTGMISTNLSSVVLSPRVYKQERCPRFLTVPEVESVLAAIDRQTPRGRRNFAMILLLTQYGLRGKEVRLLRLEDFDWRNQRLHVRRRKAGNSTTYPLIPAVGEAVVAYVRNDRPPSPHREVFLSSKPPFLPLVTTAALGRLARRFMATAGVTVDRAGTHTFRYSCAQRLLEKELPLKVIGDFLGHRDPGSTQRYTKIAISQLRQIALNDGEDLL